MKKAWVLSYPLSAQQRLWSDWANAQADLSLRWAHTHFVGFVMSRLSYVLHSLRVESSNPLLSHFLTDLDFLVLNFEHRNGNSNGTVLLTIYDYWYNGKAHSKSVCSQIKCISQITSFHLSSFQLWVMLLHLLSYECFHCSQRNSFLIFIQMLVVCKDFNYLSPIFKSRKLMTLQKSLFSGEDSISP